MIRPTPVVAGKPILKILQDHDGKWVIELHPNEIRIRPLGSRSPEARAEITPRRLYQKLLLSRVEPIARRR